MNSQGVFTEEAATAAQGVADPKNVEEKEGSLEIKDPAIIFNNVWNKLEKKYGLENMRFPKEIIWLMGAPVRLLD